MPIPTKEITLVTTSQEEKLTGLNFPLDNSGIGGFFTMGEGVALLRQSILQILMTLPGERPMLPQFGTNLRRLAFSQNDAIMKNEIEREIKQGINKFEQRVIVNNIKVETVDDNKVKITLSYSPKNDYQNPVSLEVFING